MGLLDSLGYGGGGLLDFLQSLQQNSFSGLPSDQAQYGATPQYNQPMDAMARMQPRPVPAPQMPQQPPQPPAQQAPQAPQPQGPDIGDKFLTGAQSFLNGGGLISAIRGAANNQRTDPAGIALQNQNAQFKAFQEAGLTPSQAMIAVSNPKLAEKLMDKLSPTYSAHNVGNTALVFNPATGTMQPAYTEPKYEKLGPGENLVSVGGGGKANTVASGGPEKPPANYQWVDPNDQSKGVTAIPGGPGTHLPSETAGRIAMMETGAAALPEARKVLMANRGGFGLKGVPGIEATLGTGDISRANRSVSIAIEGALRAMTGAAAPESEVKRYEDMFMPKPMDSDKTAAQKLNKLDDFISEAKRLVNQGRGPAGNAPAGRPSDPLGIR